MCEFVSAILYRRHAHGKIEVFSDKSLDSHSGAIYRHDLNEHKCLATVEWVRQNGEQYLTVLSCSEEVPNRHYEEYIYRRWGNRQSFINQLLLDHLRAGRLPAGLQNLSLPYWTPADFMQFCKEEYQRFIDFRKQAWDNNPNEYVLHHYWVVAEKAFQAYQEASDQPIRYFEQRMFLKGRLVELLRDAPSPNPGWFVDRWYANGNGGIVVDFALTMLKLDDLSDWYTMNEDERNPMDAMSDAYKIGIRFAQETRDADKGMCDRFLAAMEKKESEYKPA